MRFLEIGASNVKGMLRYANSETLIPLRNENRSLNCEFQEGQIPKEYTRIIIIIISLLALIFSAGSTGESQWAQVESLLRRFVLVCRQYTSITSSYVVASLTPGCFKSDLPEKQTQCHNTLRKFILRSRKLKLNDWLKYCTVQYRILQN